MLTERMKIMMNTMKDHIKDINTEVRLLVTTAELCDLLSCGRRNAEKIGTLAKSQIVIGNLRRWNVDKIRQFLNHESI